VALRGFFIGGVVSIGAVLMAIWFILCEVDTDEGCGIARDWWVAHHEPHANARPVKVSRFLFHGPR